MAILNISGNDVAAPADFQWQLSDISSDSSGRNAAGDMLKDRIAQKVKLTCKWAFMTQAQAASLLQAVNATIFFTVAYPDPMQGATVTHTFYVGDRMTPLYSCQNGVPGWKDIAFDFIQK